jgi:His-Xaa-Ser system protein HxsD
MIDTPISVQRQLLIDPRVYRITAVKKASYRVAALCTATVESATEDRIAVSILFRPGASEATVEEAIRRFHEELLDQELRELVAEETTALRTLILAQAFSRTDLIERG